MILYQKQAQAKPGSPVPSQQAEARGSQVYGLPRVQIKFKAG